MPGSTVLTVYNGQLFKGNPAIKGYDPIVQGPVEVTIEPVANKWMLTAHKEQNKVWEDVINGEIKSCKLRDNFIQWTIVRPGGHKDMFGLRIREIPLAKKFMDELSGVSAKSPPPSNVRVVRVRLPSKEIIVMICNIEMTMIQVMKEIASIKQFDSSSCALGLGSSNESPQFMKSSMTVGQIGPKLLTVWRRKKSAPVQEKPKISVESASPMISIGITLPSEEQRSFSVYPSILLPDLLMLVCDSVGLHPDRHQFDLPIQNQSKVKLHQLRLTELTLKEKEGPVEKTEATGGIESTDSGETHQKYNPKKKAPLAPHSPLKRGSGSPVVQAHMRLRSNTSPMIESRNRDDVNDMISSLLIQQAVGKSAPPQTSPTVIKRSAPDPPGKTKRSAPPPPSSKEEKKTEPHQPKETLSIKPHLGIPLPSMVKKQPPVNDDGSKNSYSISPTVGRRQSREKQPVIPDDDTPTESTDHYSPKRKTGSVEPPHLKATSSPPILHSSKQPSRKAPTKPVPNQSPKLARASEDLSPQIIDRSGSVDSPRARPSPVHSSKQPSRKAPTKPVPYQSPKLVRPSEDLSPQIIDRSGSVDSPRVSHVHSTKQPSRKAPTKPAPYQSPKLARATEDLSPQIIDRSGSVDSPRVSHPSPVHSSKQQPSRKAPNKPAPYQSPKLVRPSEMPVTESVSKPTEHTQATPAVPLSPQKPISFKIPPPPPKKPKEPNKDETKELEERVKREEERKMREQERMERERREKEIKEKEERMERERKEQEDDEESDSESVTSDKSSSIEGYDINKDIDDSSNEEVDAKSDQGDSYQKESSSSSQSSDSDTSKEESEEDNDGGIVLLKHEIVTAPDDLPYIPSPPPSPIHDDPVLDKAIYQLNNIEGPSSSDTVSDDHKKVDSMVASLRTLIADTCEITGTDHVTTNLTEKPFNLTDVKELAPPVDNQSITTPTLPFSQTSSQVSQSSTTTPPPPPPLPVPSSSKPPISKKPPPPLVKPKPKPKHSVAEKTDSVEDELKLKLQQRQQKIKEESLKKGDDRPETSLSLNTDTTSRVTSSVNNTQPTTAPPAEPTGGGPSSSSNTDGGTGTDLQSQLQMLQQQMLQQQMMQLQQQFQQLQQQLMSAGGGGQYNPLLMQQFQGGVMPPAPGQYPPTMGYPPQMMPPQMMTFPGMIPPPTTATYSTVPNSTIPNSPPTAVPVPPFLPVAPPTVPMPGVSPVASTLPVAPPTTASLPLPTQIPPPTIPDAPPTVPDAPPTVPPFNSETTPTSSEITNLRSRKISEADRRSVALGKIEGKFDSLMEEMKEINPEEILAKVTDMKEPESAYTGMTAALIEAMQERRRHFSTDGSFTADTTSSIDLGDDTTNEWGEEDL